MRGVRAKNLSVWIGSREVVKELDFEIKLGTLWLVCGDCETEKITQPPQSLWHMRPISWIFLGR
ncbi:MAG: hypothetical protein QXO97_10435 [Candidatus Nezhaarchaeales archaeon]